MVFQDSILLPSQEALLQRLQHISLYGQQLIVVSGDDGAGKTTLVTALLNELEQYSAALVTCPKHCSSSEIRRKILIQLLAEPLFDDELPLAETLLRESSSLPQLSCIVLDDAHLLPLELWAECIVLSQLSFGGKSINVTLTAPTIFLKDVISQLPPDQRDLILPMNIEPLPMTEREALYYTLLSRSEAMPFTPRDIVKNRLETQQGTPKEVVALLELALHGEPETQKVKRWHHLLMLVVLFLFVAVISIGLMQGDEDTIERVQAEKLVMDPMRRESLIVDHGRRLLAGYFVANNEVQTAKVGFSLLTDTNALNNTASLIDKGALGEVRDAAGDGPKESEAQLGGNDVIIARDDTNFTKAQIAVVPPPTIDKPVKGYTLQLASVKRLDSLMRLLEQLDGAAGIKVAKYKERWVVLMGEFDTLELAGQESVALTDKYGVSAPWIRKWQDLSEYELQLTLPIREIQ